MGANSKEIHLIDSIKSGDLHAAVKILNKNVKHVATATGTAGNTGTLAATSSASSRFKLAAATDIYATLSKKNSSKPYLCFIFDSETFLAIKTHAYT